ncbi:MAG: single-stranded DNA-binding protein [Spirochaetales bacterium]|nr:single-stranded DNA-binding protein [Spirochaetales bacterium]
MSRTDTGTALILLYRTLAREIDTLSFGPPVAFTYNPLVYAREPFEKYLSLYANGTGKTIFMGMNPGPWGMLQTGIPFGEVETVRGWLGVTGRVRQPDKLHPKRPVQGFACTRREVSGQRLWGLFRSRFKAARNFFRNHVVINYCPLGFFNRQGTNITPDKLPKGDRESLLDLCDDSLSRVLAVLEPRFAIGVGRFAEGRLRDVVTRAGTGDGGKIPPYARVKIVGILHPSPASPAANKGWETAVIRTLTEAGVWR